MESAGARERARGCGACVLKLATSTRPTPRTRVPSCAVGGDTSSTPAWGNGASTSALAAWAATPPDSAMVSASTHDRRAEALRLSRRRRAPATRHPTRPGDPPVGDPSPARCVVASSLMRGGTLPALYTWRSLVCTGFHPDPARRQPALSARLRPCSELARAQAACGGVRRRLDAVVRRLEVGGTRWAGRQLHVSACVARHERPLLRGRHGGASQ